MAGAAFADVWKEEVARTGPDQERVSASLRQGDLDEVIAALGSGDGAESRESRLARAVLYLARERKPEWFSDGVLRRWADVVEARAARVLQGWREQRDGACLRSFYWSVFDMFPSPPSAGELIKLLGEPTSEDTDRVAGHRLMWYGSSVVELFFEADASGQIVGWRSA